MLVTDFSEISWCKVSVVSILAPTLGADMLIPEMSPTERFGL